MTVSEWAWGISERADRWIAGGPTREDAIQRGREVFEGRSFWVDSMTPIDFRRFIPESDQVLDDAELAAYENAAGGDDMEWSVSRTGPAAKDLAKVLADWCDRHADELRVEWYECDGKQELIPEVGK